MKTSSVILMCLALLAGAVVPDAAAQDGGLVVEKIEAHSVEPINLAPLGTMTQKPFISSEGIAMGYWIYEPGEKVSEKLPLIVYLHGGNFRGNDLARVLERSLPKYLATKINIPAIVVCPQCPADKYWWDATMPAAVDEFIAKILETNPVDKRRISLTGHSMGGDVRMTIVMGTFHGNVPDSVYMEPAVVEWLLCR